MTTPTPTDAPWWHDLYDELLAETLLVREDRDETSRTVAFMLERTGLAQGARVYDQCCGIGSLSFPLARAGMRVVGVDQAAGYIERAERERAKSSADLRERIRFDVGDAFDYICETRCDLAINWWTSFGYADDTRNRGMLESAYASLRPGGWFMLDTMNLAGVFRHFERDVVIERDTPLGPVTLHRRSRIDLAQGRILKTWSFHRPERSPVRRHTSVRLYLPHQLAGMLQQVGFRSVEVRSGIDDRPLTLDDARCLVIARHPS